MGNRIETLRLIPRPFKEDDLLEAFSWFGDPLVMRFTPRGPDLDIAETAARLATYRRRQTEHGFSKWAIADRNSGRAIGDAGLLFVPEYDWIDFGCRLAHPYWGRGLATEAGGAWWNGHSQNSCFRVSFQSFTRISRIHSSPSEIAIC